MPVAPRSNPSPRSGEVWRLVEAQHRISTWKLVDSLDEQVRLERVLDTTKPTIPEECRHLHFLLFTPFRYAASHDSRFRRAGAVPGVFYAAERIETSVAEFAFWRLLFFVESVGTPWPSNPLEATAFRVRYDVEACLDLTAPPYDDRLELWTHPTDYAASQQAAEDARGQGCAAIRSLSARDPNAGATLALLSCAAFVDVAPIPTDYRTWRIRLHRAGVSCLCEAPRTEIDFDRAAFARDPRVQTFNWSR